MLLDTFPLFWWAELLDHFRYHAIAGGVFVWFCCLPKRTRDLAIYPGCGVLVLLALTYRQAVPFVPPTPSGQAGETLVVVHANLGNTPEIDTLADWITGQSAEVISLQEVTPDRLIELDTALVGYTRRVAEPREDTRGVAIWVLSEIEVDDAEVIWPHADGGADRPVASVTLADTDPPLTLVGVHAARPRNADRAETQRQELYDLVDALPHERDRAVVLVGDFNATPWSGMIRDVSERSSLRRVRNQDGWPTTWPDGMFRVIGIPIDFAMARNVKAAASSVGPSFGSDHRPVVVRIQP